MKYTRVKDFDAARVVLGTGYFGTTVPEDIATDILMAYIEAGGNIVDTANAYGNWEPLPVRSVAEKWLGKQFKTNPNLREKLIISTKGGHFELWDPAKTSRVNEACITYDLENSLRNMGVDTIDFYWVHYDNPTYPVSLIMDALFMAQDAGKIHHFGASNWSLRRILTANKYAASCGREGFFGSQLMYSYALPINVQSHWNLYFDEAVEGPGYRREALAMFWYSSQARAYVTGVLSGTDMSPVTAYEFDCKANRERAERARAVALELGPLVHPEQVGLAWLHCLPYDAFTIVGPQKVEELLISVGACDITLTPEQFKFLSDDKTPHPIAPQLGH